MDLYQNQQLLQAKKLQQNKKLQAAKAIYLKILKSHPRHPDVLHLMGILHHQLKEYDTAIEFFQRTMELTPNSPQLYHNLGLTYKDQGKNQQAMHCYQRALQLNPNYASAYDKIGVLYSIMGDYPLAIDHFQKALQLEPKNPEFWAHCALTFKSYLMWPESKEAYENALRYKPDLVPALHGLASLLRGMNKTEEAISYFKKALQLDPNHNRAFAELACLYDLTCYWPGYTEREKKLHLLSKASIAKEQPPPIDALSMIYRDWPAQEILTLMGNFGRFSLEQLPTYQKQVNFTFTKTAKKRLRIGYLSSDFTNHPVAHLTNNLYAHHNREQFEVVGFYLGDDTSSVYYKHIAASCDKFISLFNAKDVEGAKKIYAENIDILIDLNGYTKGCRSYMLALKPAPIQAHYLGFLAPMAAPYIDYVIADEWVIPPTTAAIGYSEKPVYLPYYQVYDNKTEISDKPLQRKDYDLPEDKFVYCCFNNTYKIQPQIFAVWMKILAQAPNSVLWLLKTSDLVKHNLFEAAKAHGIDTARLIFAGYEERSLYLARYRLADLFLDTPFYNANTTGSDALWAGLPLLTYPTPNFAGRGASSALRALGVPELIASDLKNYQEIALHFYNNPEALAQIRAKMAAQRDTSQLFDMQNTIRHLEKGYQTMWEIYLRGETPRPIKTY